MDLFPLWAAVVIILVIVSVMVYLVLSDRRSGNRGDREQEEDREGGL